jgi:hypothetical protein
MKTKTNTDSTICDRYRRCAVGNSLRVMRSRWGREGLLEMTPPLRVRSSEKEN